MINFVQSNVWNSVRYNAMGCVASNVRGSVWVGVRISIQYTVQSSNGSSGDNGLVTSQIRWSVQNSVWQALVPNVPYLVEESIGGVEEIVALDPLGRIVTDVLSHVRDCLLEVV